MTNVLLLLLGAALLAAGGEALVRGALAAARRLGVSPLLSGLVIVGFGTSAPELVVSIDAAVHHRPDVALGNIVGSNIGNILLILGLAAVISPLAVKPLALRRDAVTVVAASGLFLVLAGDGALGPWDAMALLLGLATYLVWAMRSERSHVTPAGERYRQEAEELTVVPRSAAWTVTAVVGGLLLLIAGSQVLLTGAVGLARHLGVSEAAIGLTLVAVGTSLPELTVSVLAAVRRHADVAVGNVLGSNIFNLLGILGVSALLQPLPVHERIQAFDQWAMVGTAALLLVFLYTGRCLSRREGGVLMAGYAAYVALGFLAFGS
jgi:cation:H+ antiporter